MACGDLGSRSRCCAGYSVVGALFTLWVAIMLNAQPFFIGGIKDATEARNNAFGAFIMFVTVFIISAVGIWYDTNLQKDDIEFTEAGESETEYQLAGEYTSYGTN